MLACRHTVTPCFSPNIAKLSIVVNPGVFLSGYSPLTQLSVYKPVNSTNPRSPDKFPVRSWKPGIPSRSQSSHTVRQTDRNFQNSKNSVLSVYRSANLHRSSQATVNIRQYSWTSHCQSGYNATVDLYNMNFQVSVKNGNGKTEYSISGYPLLSVR